MLGLCFRASVVFLPGRFLTTGAGVHNPPIPTPWGRLGPRAFPPGQGMGGRVRHAPGQRGPPVGTRCKVLLLSSDDPTKPVKPARSDIHRIMVELADKGRADKRGNHMYHLCDGFKGGSMPSFLLGLSIIRTAR